MRAIAGLVLFTVACSSSPSKLPMPVAAPDAAPPPIDAAPPPPSPPADAAPPDLEAARTVRARFVKGDKRFIACGVIAFIGVYVYEVVEVEAGPPLSGQFVVDVLCPDMALGKGVKLAPGEVHRLTLGRARRSYAGSTAPESPAKDLPRFEASKVELAK